MDYYLILKYQYSYICSGNYYKEVKKDYYQLFKNKEEYEFFALEYGTMPEIKIKKIEENEVHFSYEYIKYTNPNTFLTETVLIVNDYIIKKGEKLNCKCIETYWAYAKGGENCPAQLTIEIIDYEKFINKMLKEIKDDPYKAQKLGAFLIDNEQYDLAFEVLSKSKLQTYELGLCYEKGFGTKKNITKAIDIYIKNINDTKCSNALQTILSDMSGENVVLDKINKTVLYEKIGKHIEKYNLCFIPLEFNNKQLKNARRNVELSIIKFLEIGRPHNDPFGNPTHTMEHLALYYDKINKVSEENKKVYYESWYEKDIYDGGSFKKERFYEDLIIETIQQEANKNDVIALGVLINQYYDKINNHNELVEKLESIIKNDNENNKAMAYYFLGLYYELIANTAKQTYERNYSIDRTYTYVGDNIEKEIKEYIETNKIEYYNKLSELLSKLSSEVRILSNKEGKEEEINKLNNYILYIYNKNYNEQSKIYNENINKAYNNFENALKNGLYLSVCHLANKYIEESPNEVINKLAKYIDYIPQTLSNNTSKFYDVITIAYLYYENDYKKAKQYVYVSKYKLEFEKILCRILECIENKSNITNEVMHNISSLKEPYIKTPMMKYLYCIIAYSDFYQNQYIGKYSYMKYKAEQLQKDESLNFKYMKEAAEEGYVPAFRRLASWYKEGFGTEINLELSKNWMDKFNEAIKDNEQLKYSILGKIFDDDLTYSNKKTYNTII